MELIDGLDQNVWKNGDANQKTGFLQFRIARAVKLGGGEIKYQCFDEEGMGYNFFLKDIAGKSDPLNGVNVVDFKVDNEGKITGIIVEDDCAMCDT